MSEPQVVGPYTLETVIGQGGMGRVYLARQAGLDRRVALKIIIPLRLDESDMLRRFQREALAMSKIQHPNVVRVFDAGKDRDTLWLAMEYVEGQTLMSILKASGQLPVTEAIGIVRDLCRGLSAVHEAGLIHRDIKPGNVMVSTDGITKLMDFGLVKDPGATALTEAGAIPGTPAYVAPEILTGEPGDHRADIYQAGMLLFVMLAGRLPHEFPNLTAYLQAVVRDRPPPLSSFNRDVPHALDALVLTALSLRPESRFRTADAMADALDRVFVDCSVAGMRRPARRVESPGEKTLPLPKADPRPSPPKSSQVPTSPSKSSRGLSLRAVVPLLGLALCAALGAGFLLSDRQSTRSSTSTSTSTSTPTPSLTPTLTSPSSGASAPKEIEIASACTSLTRALAFLTPSSFSSIRSSLRAALARHDASAARELERSLRASTSSTFSSSSPVHDAISRYLAIAPSVASCDALSPADRSSLLRSVSTLELYRRFLLEAFGGTWAIPELPCPGLSLAPGAVGTVDVISAIAIPPPGSFNEAEQMFISAAQSELRVDLRAPQRAPARAALSFRIAGGDPTARLVVRIAPPGETLEGSEAAVLQAPGVQRRLESAVVVDARLLAVPHAELTVHYTHESTLFGSRAITLESLVLLGR